MHTIFHFGQPPTLNLDIPTLRVINCRSLNDQLSDQSTSENPTQLKMHLFGLPTLAAIAALVGTVLADKQLENRQLFRTIDLSKSYVREFIAVNVYNDGNSDETDYIISVPPSLADDVAKMDVKESQHQEPLKVIKLTQDDHGVHYSAVLPEPLKPGQQIQLQLFLSFVDQLQPLPETIKQSEQQYIKYEGLKTFYSVYPTKSQTTRVKIMAQNMQELNMQDDSTQATEAEGGAQYGPFGPKESFDVEPIVLRYDYPLPIPRVDSLKRDIWISHVSNSISIEESYNLTNAGAKLDGSFSRTDFMSHHGKPSSASASIIELPFTLPLYSEDVYFTDLVGNVSTSHFRGGSEVSLLELRPRYPVFGGWNYNFTIGWTMPLNTVSRTTGNDQFVVGLPLLNGPVDAQYEKLESNYILPEGAENVQVVSSEPALSQEDTVTFSYLDKKGRPSIKVTHKNFVDLHRGGIVFLKYTLPSSAASIKPVFIGSVIGAIFLAIFSLSQLDFSISKKVAKASN